MMFKLKEGKISSYGVFHILIILVISNAFLGVPRTMAVEGDSAGWLLLLLAGIVASVGIFFIIKLLKKFPGKNFIEIAEILWGRPGAVIVALIFAGTALSTTTITLREFSETVLTSVLPRTPISIVTLCFIIAVLYGSYKGLEVITRTSVLLFPFILGGILSLLLLTANYVNINNMFPLLGSGLGHLLYHAPGRSSIYLEIMLAGFIVSNVTDHEKVSHQIWKAFGIILFLYVTVELFYISVLRITAAQNLYIPLFQVARIIYMGRFVQRIEAVYVFIWFFTGALKLTISMYISATALCRAFRIPIYQPLLFPLSLLVFALSFVPGDMLEAVSLDMKILREYGCIIGWGIPLVMLVSSVLQKKGGDLSGPKQKTN